VLTDGGFWPFGWVGSFDRRGIVVRWSIECEHRGKDFRVGVELQCCRERVLLWMRRRCLFVWCLGFSSFAYACDLGFSGLSEVEEGVVGGGGG